MSTEQMPEAPEDRTSPTTPLSPGAPTAADAPTPPEAPAPPEMPTPPEPPAAEQTAPTTPAAARTEPTRVGPRSGPIVWGALILVFCAYVAMRALGVAVDTTTWAITTVIGLGALLLVVGAVVLVRNAGDRN